MQDSILEWVEYTGVDAGAAGGRERIVIETGLSIYINQRHLATAMIMPTMPKEFVVGHLFARGIINSVTDIKSITVEDNRVQVTLPEPGDQDKGCPVIHSDFKIRREEIFNSVRAILKSQVFTETEAVHSAGLFRGGPTAICLAEDIGRHNALDKVIGYGLLNNIDFSRTLAASTGRQPAEMILRCCRANIPIVATKGVPTMMAIDIAEKAGLTIVGLVRGNTMITYTNPARIE